jgi:hypothetical protein
MLLELRVFRLGEDSMAEQEKFTQADFERVEELWSKVFEFSNRVLLQHQKFGINGMAALPHPSVQQMVVVLKILGGTIDVLLSAAVFPYDESRLLLNARKQITNFESLALALEAQDRDGYEAAIAELDRQAVF